MARLRPGTFRTSMAQISSEPEIISGDLELAGTLRLADGILPSEFDSRALGFGLARVRLECRRHGIIRQTGQREENGRHET
jgi:hypothetical protein